MKNQTITNIINSFTTEYMERLSRYSMKEIAEKIGVKLTSFSDNITLADAIGCCMFADLFHHKPFLDAPILGYYVKHDKHYFAIEEIGSAYCEHCDTFHPIHNFIYVSPSEYGIEENMLNEDDMVTLHNYKTVRDIIPFLKQHTDLLDSTFML